MFSESRFPSLVSKCYKTISSPERLASLESESEYMPAILYSIEFPIGSRFPSALASLYPNPAICNV